MDKTISEKNAIVLVGYGSYASEAHLPEICEEHKKGLIELVSVIDFEKRKCQRLEQIKNQCSYCSTKCHEREDFYVSVPDSWHRRYPPVSTQEVEDCLCKLKKRLNNYKKVGILISTAEIAHLPYVEWALKQGYHVLVDKPINVTPYCSTRRESARKLVREYDNLVRLSEDKRCLFMVAAQKRYSGVFQAIAKLFKEPDLLRISGKSVPITAVTAYTNDGVWAFTVECEEKYKRYQWFYRDENGDLKVRSPRDPKADSGGKVTHTVYHLLDIIPWLMRKSGVRLIDHAVVFAMFERPADIIAKLPLKRNTGGRIERLSSQRNMYGKVKIDGEDINGYEDIECNEVNAMINILFRDRNGHIMCPVMIDSKHLGYARLLKDGTVLHGQENRLKGDLMMIECGPYAIRYERQYLGVSTGNEKDFGGSDHHDLKVMKPGNAVHDLSCKIKKEDDGLSARDFIKALKTDEPHTYKSTSLARDHSVAMKLMSAVYDSAITGSSVMVSFKAQEWSANHCTDGYSL